MRSTTAKQIADSLEKLLKYCEANNWQGYDPYDGLTSKLFQLTPLKRSHFARLALIQLCKRSPVNFRRILGVRKDCNPKGVGLLLSSAVKLDFCLNERNRQHYVFRMASLLQEQSIKGYAGSCWGYNFDWQSRLFFIPKGTPNVVSTTFVANAFLDTYEALHIPEFLEIGRSSCNFILEDLNRTPGRCGFCFSYTPLDDCQVHNANFLAAALLARVYSYTKEDRLRDLARSAVEFSVSFQNEDGSWYYGNHPSQKWIDNFHTGYNLVALSDYICFSKDDVFEEALKKGFAYYRDNLFLADGTPKYFDRCVYPVDIHSAAQAIVTFVKLKDLDDSNLSRAKQIALWAIENMQDRRGYFYFQKHRLYTNRIAYMRWSQAWMVYALSLLLSESNSKAVIEEPTYADAIRDASSVLFG